MTRTPALLGATLIALWLAPMAAWGDDTGDAPQVGIQGPPVPPPNTVLQPTSSGGYEGDGFTGQAAIRDWNARRPWSYGSQQLFPVTRGMDDAGIPMGFWWLLFPFTASFDFGNAVFSAIGGLYGD